MSTIIATTVEATNISDGTLSAPVDVVTEGGVKVRYVISVDASIVTSYNVTSSTDHGVGDHSVTLTNALTTVNYSHVAMCVSTGIRYAVGNASRDSASVVPVNTYSSTNVLADAVTAGVTSGELA